LFDAIDSSETLELDGVDKKVYWDVVDHCYLCDMCFMTKCPYVPPHPWNIDFPHLMLRAKHVQHKKGEHSFRDRLLSNTRGLGSIAGISVVAVAFKKENGTKVGRKLLEAALGVDATAPLPKFHSKTGSKRARALAAPAVEVKATDETRGRVALFVTCYGDRNEPQLPEDLAAVSPQRHRGRSSAGKSAACPSSTRRSRDVEKYKNFNIPQLKKLIDEGRHRRADSILRAHVQAGAAADVCG
jgi:Fe-S oxidoreductase